MVLLHTSPVVPGTVNPERTMQKWTRKWLADPTPEPTVLPGLDLAALRRKYGPHRAYEPKPFKATFQVPLGAHDATFAKEQAKVVGKWIERQEKRGWTFVGSKDVHITEGMYPAKDIETGEMILDKREYIAIAWFTHNAPTTERLEIPAWMLEPLALR